MLRAVGRRKLNHRNHGYTLKASTKAKATVSTGILSRAATTCVVLKMSAEANCASCKNITQTKNGYGCIASVVGLKLYPTRSWSQQNTTYAYANGRTVQLELMHRTRHSALGTQTPQTPLTHCG